MDIIYFLIFVMAGLSEFSNKCDTRNLIKKLSIGMIMVGALVLMAGKDNNLIEFGILGVFLSELLIAYLGKRQRRAYDKVVNG
jgi:hypothetical protein